MVDGGVDQGAVLVGLAGQGLGRGPRASVPGGVRW